MHMAMSIVGVWHGQIKNLSPGEVFIVGLITGAVAAAITTTVAAAITKAALWAVFHRVSFVDYQGATTELGVVQSILSCHCFSIVFEFYESESAAASRHLVGDDGSRGNCAVCAKHIF